MRANILTGKGVIGIHSPSHVANYEEYQHTIEAIRKKVFVFGKGRIYTRIHMVILPRFRSEHMILIN